MTSNTASPVSAINHIALMTGELDRLADFYATIFGAQILARSEGTPRKCFLRLTPATSLHLFEVGPERARRADDHAFDPSSYSKGVACTAPGVGIISTVPDRPRRKGQYMEMSGTSMATPAAAGILALILSASPDYKKLARGPARAKLARKLLARYCRSVGLQPIYQGRGLPALRRVAAAPIPRPAASSDVPRRKRGAPSRRRKSS